MLNVLVESVIPLMMANLIDLGIDAGNMTYIIKIGLALVIASACSLTFDIIAGRFAATASAGFAHNLRKDMFFNVQNFSFSNIDRFSSASIVTRLTTDVTNVQNSYQMMIRMAVRSPITLVFSMLMAFTINPQLALVFMACIPVLGVGLYLITVSYTHLDVYKRQHIDSAGTKFPTVFTVKSINFMGTTVVT